jgi:hypothetical protein
MYEVGVLSSATAFVTDFLKSVPLGQTLEKGGEGHTYRQRGDFISVLLFLKEGKQAVLFYGKHEKFCSSSSSSSSKFWVSSVSLVTELWSGGPGFKFPPGAKKYFFLFTNVSRQALGPTCSSFQDVSGALSPRVMPPGRETDRSPSYSAGIANAWTSTSAPLYIFMAWCLTQRLIKITCL